MLAIGAIRDVLAWKNSTGVARALGDPRQIIRYGLVGSSDIIVLINKGRTIFMECKTGDAILSADQRRFKACVEALDHIYTVQRNAQEAKDFVLQKLTET